MPIVAEGKRFLIAIVGRYYAVKEDGNPDYYKIEEHISLRKICCRNLNAGFAVFTT